MLVIHCELYNIIINHRVSSRTTSLVTMTMKWTLCSHTICQKSVQVCSRGPWATMQPYFLPLTVNYKQTTNTTYDFHIHVQHNAECHIPRTFLSRQLGNVHAEGQEACNTKRLPCHAPSSIEELLYRKELTLTKLALMQSLPVLLLAELSSTRVSCTAL